MKTLGFDNVLKIFNTKYDDDPDMMKNPKKRIEYGKYWCAQNDWKFMYGKIEDDVVSTFCSLTLIHADYKELWRIFIWDCWLWKILQLTTALQHHQKFFQITMLVFL